MDKKLQKIVREYLEENLILPELPSIKELICWQTSDGEIFSSKIDAETHESFLSLNCGQPLCCEQLMEEGKIAYYLKKNCKGREYAIYNCCEMTCSICGTKIHLLSTTAFAYAWEANFAVLVNLLRQGNNLAE